MTVQKSEKLLKAEARVAKWEKAKEELITRDEGKKSYFTKKVKEWYDPESDGDRDAYIERNIEGWINSVNYELKYAYSNLKERQEIEARKNAKQAKVDAEQARVDALPECVKVFLREVEVNTIKAVLVAEKGKYEAVRQMYKEDREAWKKLPYSVRYFSPRTEEEVTKEVKKNVRYMALDFISRVEEKAGEIVDTSFLRTAPSKYGTIINGYVTGTKGKAEVETIWAGGYNIQCLHCRVLVK